MYLAGSWQIRSLAQLPQTLARGCNALPLSDCVINCRRVANSHSCIAGKGETGAYLAQRTLAVTHATAVLVLGRAGHAAVGRAAVAGQHDCNGRTPRLDAALPHKNGPCWGPLAVGLHAFQTTLARY